MKHKNKKIKKVKVLSKKNKAGKVTKKTAGKCVVDFKCETKAKKLKEKLKEKELESAMLVRHDVELQRTNDAMREISEAKTQFVSVAAHQLRTPLAAVNWTFNALLSGDYGVLSEEQKGILQKGSEMNDQMIRLVADLLEVSRIESGKFSYNFIGLDLKEILESVKKFYLDKAQEKSISFSVAIPESDGVKINGDQTKVQMVFHNLLDNAFHYTKDEGSVSLSCRLTDGVAEFCVKDNGIGINKEELPQMFTKFFRGKQASNMESEGTGLGLYISKTIINAHGGKLWIESEEGKGTSVFFTLPVVKN